MIKGFGYTLIQIIPLSELEKYKDHRRLRVFFHKGCVCVNCGLEGTQLAVGRDKGGQDHIDLYTKDFYPLTIDHIQPKSKGGSNDLENLQPMCLQCNVSKGNGDKHIVEKKTQDCSGIPLDQLIGKKIFNKYNDKFIGVCRGFEINPHTGKSSMVMEDNFKSFYTLKQLSCQF